MNLESTPPLMPAENSCNELNSLVTSVSVNASSRLSLRTSSNLIGGAAKLYKHSLDKLFDDLIKMDKDLINRRKRYRLDSSSTENTDLTTESTIEFPEEMRQSAVVGFIDSSFPPTKRIRTEPTGKMTPRITMSRSSNDDSGSVNVDNTATTTKSIRDEDRENYEEALFSEEENPENQRKDKGVQTSPILTNREKTDSNMENRSREDRYQQ